MQCSEVKLSVLGVGASGKAYRRLLFAPREAQTKVLRQSWWQLAAALDKWCTAQYYYLK